MMAANILRSPKAVQMSIFLVRAFVKMRDTIHANMTILKRLAELDKRFWEHDDMIHVLIAELRNMKNQLPADDAPPAKSKKIGFLADNS